MLNPIGHERSPAAHLGAAELQVTTYEYGETPDRQTPRAIIHHKENAYARI